MQKAKVMCLILALVLATAGTAGVLIDMSDNTEAPVIPNNALNTVMDKPTEGTPIDRSAIENLYIAQGELQRKGGFVGQTRGTTTSAGISQTVINNRTVINGNVFKEMITVGAVKNAYQLYMSGDNYLYRGFKSIKNADDINWNDSAQKYSPDDFLAKFGHRSDSLTGYILNDDTIIEGKLEKEENGLYTYRYVLDIDTAPARMLYEMKANSNMSGFSTFIKAEIIVTMDADWQVKTVSTDCKYKVPMFGGLSCTEDITETFSDLTSDVLPETDFFQQFFNAEITAPVEKDPDALNVLMDMFSPYIEGNNLNVALNAEMDGQSILNGLVSAKIDIENISNIEVAAKLGNGLFVEYQQGNLFVTYQDFKASTTVDGIMGVVNAFMPKTNGGLDFDSDELLDKFTYKVTDGVCVVNLPLSLGDETANVDIYANVNDGKYEFTHAEAMIGSLALHIEPTAAFEIPARSGSYPEVLGLLDLVHNGVIYGNIDAFGIGLDVMFDLSTMSLSAIGDNMRIDYADETIFAQYGAIKVKLGLDDLDSLVTMLRLYGLVSDTNMPQMPELSVSTVLGMLSNITAVATDNGTVFTLNMDDISVALYLAATANGWSVDKVTLDLYGNSLTLAISAPFTPDEPEINSDDYADVMDIVKEFINPLVGLLNANGYGADFGFTIDANGVKYDVNGCFAYDSAKNINVKATVSNNSAKLIDADVTVVDGIAYLQINGIKVAFALGDMSLDLDLSQLVSEIYGVNAEIDSLIDFVGNVIGAVKYIDVANIDFANIIKDFRFDNGKLTVAIDASFIELGDITLQLSTKGNNLVVSADVLGMSDFKLGVNATVRSRVPKIKSLNASDYVLNVKGCVNNDICFAVSADLLNMDVSAQIDVLNQAVLVRYVNGKVYAKVGEVAIVAQIDQLAEFVSSIMAELGVEASNVDMSNFANVDLSLKSLLSALTWDTAGALSVGLKLGNVANVSVNFNNNAELVDITASIADINVKVEQSTERVAELDENDKYIPVVPLAEQLLKIYNEFKNVLSNGLQVAVEGEICIDGNLYQLRADVKYNDGLYLRATVADAANVFMVAEVYYVDNAIYLDVNGVRAASKLPETNATNGELDINAIFGVLAQAKGYNSVLDEVIDAVMELPDKLNSLDNYLDLLGSLSYDDNVLTAYIKGSLLGLSDFEVAIGGNGNINVAVEDLKLASIELQTLQLNATPSCERVVAPNGNDYVTELKLDVKGLTVFAKVDLYNKSITATTRIFDRALDVFYIDGAVYINYNGLNVMANIADVDKLLAIVNTFVSFDMPKVDLDVHEIINSLRFARSDSGYAVTVVIGSVDVRVAFDSNATLKDIAVNAGGTDISASLVYGKEYPVFNKDLNYVDVAVLAENFVEPIKSLIDADGYGITLNGSFAFDEYVYGVDAAIYYNNGLYVDADIVYGNNALIHLQLWYVQNVIYAQVGDIRFAMNLGASTNAAAGGAFGLDDVKGYNPYVDKLLALIDDIIAKFNNGSIDYIALLSGLTYRDNTLTISVNGAQLGLSEFNVGLQAVNGLCASINGLVAGNLNVNLTASVNAFNSAIEAPKGDFTTNLAIKLDEVNTVYANLDLINGVYNFRLNDMYLMYANKVIKVNKGDLYLTGNIDAIMEYINEIDNLVNEFSGATESTMVKINLDRLNDIDIKAIVNSLAIAALGDNSVSVSLKALGFDIDGVLRNGELSYLATSFTAFGKTLNVRVTPSDNSDYGDFDGDIEYIAIEQVLSDYMPSIRALVHTNSWKFSFNSDGYINIGYNKDSYRLTNDSYVEFYYKNTEGLNTMTLRAYLNVQKLDANAGTYKALMSIDAVYVPFVKNADGSVEWTRNVYITYTGDHGASLKFTVSIDSLMACLSLKDGLIEVVPQIGDLLNKINSTKDEALGNAQNLDLSSILQSASYSDGVFGLVLSGKPLISKLGEIALVARAENDSLVLNQLDVSYDNISVHIEGLRVAASEVVSGYTDENASDWQYGSQYVAVQDIANYNTSEYHIDLNSIYSLLSSFIKTATPKDESGNRSFYVDGLATVALKIVGINLADLDIGLAVKVDITEDNDVYISAKINRTKPSGLGTKFVDVYNDDGGDSYLYYDGVNETFTVIRNSWTDKYTETVYEVVRQYCSKCNSGVYSNHKCILNPVFHKDTYYTEEWDWVEKEIKFDDGYGYHERHFVAENLSTQEFTANIMDYILELFNFGSTIKDPIVNAMKEPSKNDFGVEDILKDYSYVATETGGIYFVKADLSAIDSNLGALDLDIRHDVNYNLSNLNIDVELLNGMCKAKIPFVLMDSTYGDATRIVKEVIYW